MKIISLSYDEAGYACSIATSIRNKYNTQTNFFDYLVVDFKSLIDIINLKDIKLITENFSYEDQKDFKNKTVIFNNFSKLISYHDLKCNYNNTIIDEFKKKYIRRFHRFMNDLYNDKIIFFIRYGKTSYNDIINFNNLIKNINSKLIFYLINVDYDKELDNNIIYNDIQNYIYINFFNINVKEIKSDDNYFKILECNWDFVFYKIEEIYKIYK